MTRASGTLIAVDGVNGAAIRTAARAALHGVERPRRGGISVWDASGVFEELAVADEDAGRPSPRTLLLLYAADLAFRLRWEIRPVVASGRIVVAAPYVRTAVAFGRAAGLPDAWLASLFAFAPAAGESRLVRAAPARTVAERDGFVEYACARMAPIRDKSSRHELIAEARRQLGAAAKPRPAARRTPGR